MSAFLPALFMLLAGAALTGAVLALWQSLRVAFGAVDPLVAMSGSGNVERQALEDEKAALLRNLQDLKFEWQVGKLSDDDYRSQETTLRSRAREVMRLLDADVEPFRTKAREMMQDAPQEKASKRSPYRERGRSAKDPETKVCGSCGAINDSDAEFCKKCGARIDGSDAADDAPDEAAKASSEESAVEAPAEAAQPAEGDSNESDAEERSE